jgi:hypothetical protein
MKHLHKHPFAFNITPKKKIKFICLSLFIIFMINKPASAQKNVVMKNLLQEFFVGETVATQDKNEVQITLMPAYWNKKEGTTLKSIPLMVEYGFTDRFQVQVELPYVFKDPKAEQAANRLGNAQLGFLYNILKGNKPFALSAGLQADVPTVRRRKEADDPQTWGALLIAAKQIGRVQVHVSAESEFTTTESAFQYNVAAVYPMGNWRATLEVNAIRGDEKITYLTPGVIWEGLDDFEFGVGVSKSSAEWGVTLMSTYEFSLKRKKRTGNLKLF